MARLHDMGDDARWAHVGALAAVALLLGYLETFVPIPIPGVRLGLANVAILVALGLGDVAGACWVAVVKVLAAGLLFGSPITMAYSAVGTTFALAAMVPLSRLRTMRLEMTSVVGALAHEAGQLMVAQAMLGTPLVWYGAAPLAVAGCVTGALCGVIAMRSVAAIEEGESLETNDSQAGIPIFQLRDERYPSLVHADPRFAALGLVVSSLVILRLHDIPSLVLALSIVTACCVLARVRLRDVALALRPVAVLACITLVAQVASTRGGTVALVVGSLVITNEALVQVAISTLRLACLVGVSLAYVAAQRPADMLLGMRWLLSPLTALGLSLDGPMQALEVTLRVLPLLAGQAVGQGSRLRSAGGVHAALDAFPQLVAGAYQLADELASNEG